MPDKALEQAVKSETGRTRAVKGFDDFLRAVGERIRIRRQELGMNQAALAHELGLAQNAISQYEAGSVDISICRLAQIAEVLQLQLHDLVQPPPVHPISLDAIEAALEKELDRPAYSRLAYLVGIAVEAKFREHARQYSEIAAEELRSLIEANAMHLSHVGVDIAHQD